MSVCSGKHFEGPAWSPGSCRERLFGWWIRRTCSDCVFAHGNVNLLESVAYVRLAAIQGQEFVKRALNVHVVRNFDTGGILMTVVTWQANAFDTPCVPTGNER